MTRRSLCSTVLQRPRASNDAAPAQLLEWTFRDPYLLHFIDDLQQVKVLMNYDVSYVNKLSAPVAMEAAGVPITLGDQISTTTTPDILRFRGLRLEPDNDRRDHVCDAISQTSFITGLPIRVRRTSWATISAAMGWPEYYNPGDDIPGDPVRRQRLQESPITGAPSPYDSNHYLISSNSIDGPIAITLGGALLNGTDTIQFAPPQPDMTLFNQLVKGMLVSATDNSGLIPKGTTILKTGTNDIGPFIQLNQKTGTGRQSERLQPPFKTPINDYAVNDITQLWYAWANYYVTKVFTSYPATLTGNGRLQAT